MKDQVGIKTRQADELSVFRMTIVDQNYEDLKIDLETLYESSKEQEVMNKMKQIDFSRLLYNYLSSALAWKYKYADLIEEFDEFEMTRSDFYEKLNSEIGKERFSYFRYLRNYLTHTGQSQHIVSINSGEVKIDVVMKLEMINELKEKMKKFDREKEKDEENYYDEAYNFQTSNTRDSIPTELEKFHTGIEKTDKDILSSIREET